MRLLMLLVEALPDQLASLRAALIRDFALSDEQDRPLIILSPANSRQKLCIGWHPGGQLLPGIFHRDFNLKN
jgi:hypothetical protein